MGRWTACIINIVALIFAIRAVIYLCRLVESNSSILDDNSGGDRGLGVVFYVCRDCYSFLRILQGAQVPDRIPLF